MIALAVSGAQAHSAIGSATSAKAPAPCTPAVDTQTVLSTASVILVEYPDLRGTTSFPSWVACERSTSREQLMYEVGPSGEGYHNQLDGAAAAGDAVEVAASYQDKFRCAVTVNVYDFAAGGPGTVYASDCGQADADTISQLAVNAGGNAAWVLNPTPMPMPPELYVHDSRGTRQIDSGSITNVTLSGSTLAWDNDGTAKTASLS